MRVRQLGWFYIPRSIGSWLVALLIGGFCLQVFVAIDRHSHSHSASDTLYGIFPYWAVTFLLWNWLGARAAQEG